MQILLTCTLHRDEKIMMFLLEKQQNIYFAKWKVMYCLLGLIFTTFLIINVRVRFKKLQASVNNVHVIHTMII